MYVKNRTKIANFHTPVYLTPPLMGFPWNFISAQESQKTRMMGLSDGRKSFPVGLAVLIQYQSVTATQPASQPASHVAVAITLNAKASSLKTMNWIEKWLASFMTGTTSSTAMQSLGGDRTARAGCRCQNVVFVCLFFLSRSEAGALLVRRG